MFNFLKKNQSESNEKFQTIALKINGMHCTSCSLNIDGALEDIEGVKRAETSYARSQTKVDFDGQKVSEPQLLKAITDLGYGVEKI